MGILPAPAVPLPPALFFLPWLIPFRPLSPPHLCVALARRGRRRHTDGHADGQRATQGCLPTPAPPGTGFDPPSHTHRCAVIPLNVLTFPRIEEPGGCMQMQTAIDVRVAIKGARPPPTRRRSACQSQMFPRLSAAEPQHVLPTNLCA